MRDFLRGWTWAGPTVYRHDVGGEHICTCDTEAQAKTLCDSVAQLLAEVEALRAEVERRDAQLARTVHNASEAMVGLQGLLKTVAVFADLEGISHNGRLANDRIGEILAAENITELLAALRPTTETGAL